MVYSSPADAPRAGDIILRQPKDASRRYTLGTSGEHPQIACATREEAIERANRFAQSQYVDVWLTEDDRSFTRIIECRMVTSA